MLNCSLKKNVSLCLGLVDRAVWPLPFQVALQDLQTNSKIAALLPYFVYVVSGVSDQTAGEDVSWGGDDAAACGAHGRCHQKSRLLCALVSP